MRSRKSSLGTGVAKSTERKGVGGHPRPKKHLGQHFLEAPWADKIVESLHIAPEDTFLEIGPGRGALTIPLAAKVAHLVAVEIDPDLATALPARLPPHVRVVQGDFLQLDLGALLGSLERPVRVVGNLPYNLSSPILFRLLATCARGRAIADATVMLQREVADRLMAPPGGRDYGTLAVQAALLADTVSVLTLPPGAFRPPPKVWSTVVRMSFRPPAFEFGSPDAFERIVRGVFLHRRKTLANALKPVAATFGLSAVDLLDKTGLDGSRRPETLDPSDFGSLARAVL